MNTLLTTVFSSEANISSKAPERRSQPESKQSEENSFAGALANQIQPQQSNNSTPAPATQEGNTVTSKDHGQNNNAQSASNTEQTASRQSNSSETSNQATSKGKQIAQPGNVNHQATDTSRLLVNNLLTHPTEQSSNVEKHELPQRFQQIIASLQQTRSAKSTTASQQTKPDNKQIVLPQTIQASGTEQNSSKWQHQSKLEPSAKSAALATELAQAKQNTTGQNFKFGATAAEHKNFNTTIEFTDRLANSASFALNSHSQNTQSGTEANSHNNVSSATTPQSIVAPFAPVSELTNNPVAFNGAISKPLFSAHWGADMSRQVVSMIRAGTNGSHIAELRLDPPELGPLRVTINLNDNVIQAAFSSAHASVRNAVEQALPQLQQQLQQEGLLLGEANVGHEENSPQHGSEEQKQFASLGVSPNATSKSSPLLNEAAVNRPASDSLIDTFA